MDKKMIRGAVLVTALLGAATLGFASPASQAADTTVDASISTEDHNEAVTELGKKCPKGKSCPMNKWMKAKIQKAMGTGKVKNAVGPLKIIAKNAPAGFAKWKSIATAGAEAAAKGDKKGTKASCKNCHKLYRKKYRKSAKRFSPWPS